MKRIAVIVFLALGVGASAQEFFTLETVGDPFSPGGSLENLVAPPEPEPWTNIAEFAQTIADADRVIIRDGGFDCCGPVDGQQRLVVLTNAQEIATLRRTIQLEERQAGRGGCLCCGYPGIDWYHGTNRVALTSIHHGGALRWMRWEGFPGDAMLTPESSRALARWLRDHGVPDQRAASESALDKARGTGK